MDHPVVFSPHVYFALNDRNGVKEMLKASTFDKVGLELLNTLGQQFYLNLYEKIDLKY